MRMLALLALCTGSALALGSPAHQSEGYAETTWASVHGDGRNSDHVPLLVTTHLQPQWLALKGAASWTAPTVGEDGLLYVTTGRGKGFSHLHALDRSGGVVWEAPVAQSPDDLDADAVFSAPVIDDAGHIYVSDSNQFWSYTGAGELRWVARLSDQGIEQPLISSVISGPYVGGVSADGIVVLFERASGALALPPLRLPVADINPGQLLPEGLWGNGLLDDTIRQKGWDMVRGQGYPVANTPALHPKRSRLYVAAGGLEESDGRLFAIDIGQQELSVGFATPVPVHSGSSPALSVDATRVYVIGSDGELYALDSDSGEMLWRRDTASQGAVPSVGPDDAVYVLGGDRLIAVDGLSGRVLWGNNYRDWARARHPQLWSRFGLIGSRGKADAYVDSVVTVSNGLLWATLLVGYEVNFLIREFVHPVQAYLVALDPSDGTVLEAWRVPDTSEGIVSISPTGDIYMNLLSMQASRAYGGGYQWLLPKAVRRSKPRGGIYALSPVSLSEQLTAGIQWLDTLAGNRNPLFLDGIGAQLWSSRKVLQLAVERKELDEALGRHVGLQLQRSAAALSRCRANNDDCEELYSTIESMAQALL